MHWAEFFMGMGGLASALGLGGTAFRKRLKRWAIRFLNVALGDVLKALESKVDQRFNHNDEETKRTKAEVVAMYDKVVETQHRLVRIETQFGPNGGGLRQAVNEIAVDVAELKGAFNQHVAEHKS